jgi:ABC-type Fe3+/spermidine/putrescine transport system ATPase subunit
VVLSIRPEHLGFGKATAAGQNQFTGRVIESTFLGESSEHVLEVGGRTLKFISSPPMLRASDEMTLECDPADVVLLRE